MHIVPDKHTSWYLHIVVNMLIGETDPQIQWDLPKMDNAYTGDSFSVRKEEIQCFTWNETSYLRHVCLRLSAICIQGENLILILFASKGSKCLIQTVFLAQFDELRVSEALSPLPADPSLIPAVLPALSVQCRFPKGLSWLPASHRRAVMYIWWTGAGDPLEGGSQGRTIGLTQVSWLCDQQGGSYCRWVRAGGLATDWRARGRVTRATQILLHGTDEGCLLEKTCENTVSDTVRAGSQGE